ncbi:MotA/TolQ/ExbB proton channel family protein [Candidatus Venteria ishoeyi]|uniref:MotA/TolQ/ExbB proton channel family protein n=1 Tax=Candidatus Venteria ishoeyi TaxID=1899563 RepID=UPI0025A63E8B|nr:MotA/TolQ/ExbB proton channel family protein [Candidatus Venteria ishoeyi]MDM8546002.1 MotA/TolQ/ExbB proton channel family protein [Candidatus Venteria ishoeyi]
MNKSIVLISLCLCFWHGVIAAETTAPAIQTLTELLKNVRQAQQQENQANSEREARFLAQREQQQQLLEQAKAERDELRQQGEQLRRQLTQKQQQLAQERQLFQQENQDLQAVFSQIRQLAAELQTPFSDSLVGAQFPKRNQQLQALLDTEQVPTLAEIRQLWNNLLEEMVENGQVRQFEAQVITPNGEAQTQQVIRIGLFTAISEQGRFLRYLPETGHLVELARQPPARFGLLAHKFVQNAQNSTKPAEMWLDPSRGSLLAMEVQSPDWQTRLQQAGVIGYIILGVGALGLLLALERLLVLLLERQKMRRQLKQTKQVRENNALGRLLKTYQQRTHWDTETLELKLEETILTELPRFRRGLNSLGVLAAIAPLLGLLGTVTGIIHTFQTITLMGSADPRLMSGGISEALLTTALGLIIAIPLMLLHSLLSSVSNQLSHQLDEQGTAIVAQNAELQSG